MATKALWAEITVWLATNARAVSRGKTIILETLCSLVLVMYYQNRVWYVSKYAVKHDWINAPHV